jgi:hypothetical protein
MGVERRPIQLPGFAETIVARSKPLQGLEIHRLLTLYLGPDLFITINNIRHLEANPHRL